MKFLKSVVSDFPTVPYQTLRLPTEDGESLEAWYIPADSVRTKRPNGTVILCHGHTQNRSKILAETEYFHQLGYNTLSFDFRAHGNSSGNVCTIGYRETADLKAAYDHLVQKGEKNIVFWGVSMGAATILKAIPEYNLQPRRVILECPFASLPDAVAGRLRTMHLPPHPLSELLLVWGSVERGMWSFGYQPAQYARQLTMPVLLNWGAQDQRVLRHETDEIFANLAATDKHLTVFEESGHQSFCIKEGPRWKAVVSGFLNGQPQPEPVPLARQAAP